MRLAAFNPYLLALVPATLLMAGCGGSFTLSSAGAGPLVLRSQVVGGVASGASRSGVATSASQPVMLQTSSMLHWSATTADGLPVEVKWSVTGGDPVSGAGSITPDGVYSAPGWLTEDVAHVTLHARRTGSGAAESEADTATIEVTPGFLRPVSPENLALAPGATATFSASIAEVGGTAALRFSLPTGESGALSVPTCVRSALTSNDPAYTVCSVTYTAPATPVITARSVMLEAEVALPGQTALPGTAAVSTAALLLDPAGINSNPATHQQSLALPVEMGSSAGSNADYDAAHGELTDCCGGTLGALVQDGAGNQYVLGNNHIFARSDQAIPGETIIQPGLIDNGCTPFGEGPGATPVASLAAYPLLESKGTHTDAALARVSPGMVDTTGAILELGARGTDDTLLAAPPGVSSTNGRGETARLGMMVAKSGRTTGLTCGAVSAVDTEILVDYYRDCAETEHAFRKRFTGQIVVSGAGFADAGDSGSLVVDGATAEPVGLFFAGGVDTRGVEQAMANPVADVLGDLTHTLGAGALRFVGAADHPVACLHYPAPTVVAPELSAATRESAARALELARQWAAGARTGMAVEPTLAASRDQVAPDGSALPAILLDGAQAGLNGAPNGSLPRSFGGVPTQVAAGSAAQPDAAALMRAERVRDSHAATLFALSPAIFGLGVGASADNPADTALILFVDRSEAMPTLPATVGGERLRVVRMDRPHVTRGRGRPPVSGCRPRRATQSMAPLTDGPGDALRLPPLRLP